MQRNSQLEEVSDSPVRSYGGASVLIVDDEQSIRKTLEGVFVDEGFQVWAASDGTSALEMLVQHRPAIVLLDIWMPGSDGLEVLQRIKQVDIAVPVIMMSGHATIATAMKATHLGAADFIEKPLDLRITLASVRRALHTSSELYRVDSLQTAPQGLSAGLPEVSGFNLKGLNRLVFAAQPAAGKRVVQRTLKHSAVLYGQGLHSGKKSGLIIEPLPSNSGVHFRGVSETHVVPAHVDFVDSTGFATTVRFGETQAGTIEHLMSALHAYGISNALIKCNGEVPVLDGSARRFCALFEEVGVEDQVGDWFELAVTQPVRVGNEKEYISIEPASGFTIDYTLRYGSPVGEQRFVFSLDDPAAYRDLIAPARTFGFLKDIGMLQKQGLALGGRFDNFVLFGEEGPLNGALRFPDEPVRHKILDAIGDLYLLGRRLAGKVTACMTGHSDNIALLRALQREIQR